MNQALRVLRNRSGKTPPPQMQSSECAILAATTAAFAGRPPGILVIGIEQTIEKKATRNAASRSPRPVKRSDFSAKQETLDARLLLLAQEIYVDPHDLNVYCAHTQADETRLSRRQPLPDGKKRQLLEILLEEWREKYHTGLAPETVGESDGGPPPASPTNSPTEAQLQQFASEYNELAHSFDSVKAAHFHRALAKTLAQEKLLRDACRQLGISFNQTPLSRALTEASHSLDRLAARAKQTAELAKISTRNPPKRRAKDPGGYAYLLASFEAWQRLQQEQGERQRFSASDWLDARRDWPIRVERFFAQLREKKPDSAPRKVLDAAIATARRQRTREAKTHQQ